MTTLQQDEEVEYDAVDQEDEETDDYDDGWKTKCKRVKNLFSQSPHFHVFPSFNMG